MGIMDMQCVEQLGEGDDKDRRGSHSVGQKPEEQVLVAEEVVARKGIRPWNSNDQHYYYIHKHVDKGVLKAVHPDFGGENFFIIIEGQFLRKEG